MAVEIREDVQEQRPTLETVGSGPSLVAGKGRENTVELIEL